MIKFKSDTDRDRVLRDLEIDMNEEFRATIQYICHRISTHDRNRVLAEAFKSAALDEMAHILYFSDFITKCGVTPRFSDWDIDKSNDIKTMLEKDIALEKDAKKRYSSQIESMKDYPDLVSIIMDVLQDEEDHETEFTRHINKIS